MMGADYLDSLRSGATPMRVYRTELSDSILQDTFT